jgi:hypothetical protein
VPIWALASLVLFGTAADPKTEERHRKTAVDFSQSGFEPNEPKPNPINPQQIKVYHEPA